MAAKKQSKQPDPAPGGSSRLARKLAMSVLTLVAVGGVVWGIKWLGDDARRGIAQRDRYSIRFLDIDCDPPPGFKRVIFLAEVRYQSKFPETFQSLDPDLSPKLTAAFAAHPWVAAVESVSVEPPSRVRVALKYRVPALAVNLAGAKGNGSVRIVDGAGVLLPRDADAAGLPELMTPVLAPTIASGKKWPDETVLRAVELLEAHRPRKLAKTPTGWRLTLADGKTVLVEK